MSNFNESVRIATRAHSNFNFTPQRIGTTDFGKILPIYCEDVLPTDKFNISQDFFIRLAPMAVPTYGRIRCYVNFFYVMNRNIIEDWDLMTSGGSTGTYPEDFPFVSPCFLNDVMQDWSENNRDFFHLANSFGIPLSESFLNEYENYHVESYNNIEAFPISLCPWLVYNQIFSRYYAPVDLYDDDYFERAYFTKVRGKFDFYDDFSAYFGEYSQQRYSVPANFFDMKYCSYKKDYLNTAYTRPQRGLQALVPVRTLAGENTNFALTWNGDFGISQSGSSNPQFELGGFVSGNTAYFNNLYAGETSQSGVNGFVEDATFADEYTIANLSTYSFRFADALQRVLERNNIAGSRYLEQMLTRWGVKLTAERLDLPQYLGGTEFLIQIGDVTATSNSQIGQVTSYLGEQTGKGIGSGSISINFDVPDHGWIMGLLHIVPDTNGSVQGLPKKFTRTTREDYFLPEYEDCGLVPIFNREVCMNRSDFGSQIKPLGGVFGYQSPYYEYKFMNDVLFGDFATSYDNREFMPDTTLPWHLERVFGKENSTLNELFPQIGFSNTYDRIFIDTDNNYDHFYVWIQSNIKANRPMLGFADAALAFANESGSGRMNVPYGGTRL